MSNQDQATRIDWAKSDLQLQINELTHLAREILEMPGCAVLYDRAEGIIEQLEGIRERL